MTSGPQDSSNGLIKHFGLIDTGSVRAQDNQTGVRTGAGLELLFDKPSITSYIVSYDRDASLYRDLNIDARNINIRNQGGGKVSLPAGSAQANIGGFNGANSFSTASGPWVESTIQVVVTSTGAPLTRIEWSVCHSNSLAGALNYVGVGWDGIVQFNVAQSHSPGVSYHMTSSGTTYAALGAGVHRIALFFGVNSGTLQVQSINNMLYVTEQRA